jgi:hypothetical protein
MPGRITYTTTIANTTMQSPLTVANVFALNDVFAMTLPVGSVQDINLYWGYTANDPYYTDVRNVSRSASGVVEVSNFGSTTGFTFSLANVVQDRNAQVNEFAVLNALNTELMAGTLMTWYPDYDNFPAEYYSCVANQRLNAKRIGTTSRWQFDFDLMVLATVQFPSTVPTFALA